MGGWTSDVGAGVFVVLDEVVWHCGVGGEIALFVVWFWVGGVDDSRWDAVGQALGGIISGGHVGYLAISGDVQCHCQAVCAGVVAIAMGFLRLAAMGGDV